MFIGLGRALKRSKVSWWTVCGIAWMHETTHLTWPIIKRGRENKDLYSIWNEHERSRDIKRELPHLRENLGWTCYLIRELSYQDQSVRMLGWQEQQGWAVRSMDAAQALALNQWPRCSFVTRKRRQGKGKDNRAIIAYFWWELEPPTTRRCCTWELFVEHPSSSVQCKKSTQMQKNLVLGTERPENENHRPNIAQDACKIVKLTRLSKEASSLAECCCWLAAETCDCNLDVYTKKWLVDYGCVARVWLCGNCGFCQYSDTFPQLSSGLKRKFPW